MGNQHVNALYEQEISKHNAALSTLNRRAILLGWLRFLIIVLLFGSIWLFWTGPIILLILTPLFFVASFLITLSKDLNNKTAIANCEKLILINETELSVLQHQYTRLYSGEELKPATHPYANDLDIFGRASLFQYINRANTEQGKRLLADWLLRPAPVERIPQRQEAIRELAPELEWRQQFQSYGKDSEVTIAIEQKITEWIAEPIHFLNKTHWLVLRYVLPLVSFGLLGVHIAGQLSAALFYPLIFLQLFISLGISRKMMRAYLQLNKVAPQLEAFSGCLGWMETKSFHSTLLKKSREEEPPASQKIKKLKNILDLLDIRLNPLVFLPLNAFLFWDLQQVLALEKWKTGNKENVKSWFDEVAEMEALVSLATLSFNHPHWVFPVLTTEKGVFRGENIGHPLIPTGKLVLNSFSTAGLNQMNIITGSNMAGKSTFLRSIGVNMVLAMMGAPACATQLSVSPMKVMSSMRISDNLEESTSTFYAELKKLKTIIDTVYAGESVFLLLDEILRGTNSADRHTGSVALIKQLIHHNAAGLIATHDLALAKLEDVYPNNIHNYHFDVQVANEELYFDYQLKRGVCTSMNASILMKKIGIEL